MPSETLARNIFISGEYTIYFRPEDAANPFFRIYAQKLHDVLNRVETLKPLNILDLGGGMGRVSVPLAKNEGRTVVLADLSSDMLKLAAERAGGGRLPHRINTDAGVLPFADESFECITALDLLCHLPNPDKALQGIWRILCKDGSLILDNTNGSPWWVPFYPRYVGWSPWKLWATMRLRGVLPPWKNIVRHYRMKEFQALLERNGFAIQETLCYGPRMCPKWHLVVARKRGNTT